jgi:hypothetical protein
MRYEFGVSEGVILLQPAEALPVMGHGRRGYEAGASVPSLAWRAAVR